MIEKYYDIVVIGCGISCGFLISFLKDEKFNKFPKILILDRNPVPFKKLLATGNGRCNFSNLVINKEDYYSISSNKKWFETVFNKTKNFDLKKYFYDKGIFYTYDEYGRIFPYTKSAKTIERYFISNLKNADVELLLNTDVNNVIKNNGVYKIFLEDKKNNKKFFVETKAVIFATGSKAYPKFGTDGSCFKILQKLGHTHTDLLCGIVPLVSKEKDFHILDGIKMDCGLKFKNFYRKGEMLFTNYGISGPNVLYVSNLVSLELQKGEIVLEIDFLPEKFMTLDFYKNIFYKKSRCSLLEIFSGSVNEKFISVVASKIFRTNFDVNKNITIKELERFYLGIRNYKITISGTKTFDEAQVTIGGIYCDQIDEHTFESKISSGIYFIGEILDFTGGCGGYNIHFCATTAKVVSEEIFKLFN